MPPHNRIIPHLRILVRYNFAVKPAERLMFSFGRNTHNGGSVRHVADHHSTGPHNDLVITMYQFADLFLCLPASSFPHFYLMPVPESCQRMTRGQYGKQSVRLFIRTAAPYN